MVALCLFALANLGLYGGFGLLWRFGLVPIWLAVTVWALFWWPCVAVTSEGVMVRNVSHTVDLAWAAIERIDTRWALTFFTRRGKVTAFAAPAPSTFSSHRARPADFKGLPESTYVIDSVRPGDLPHTPSGHAALVIRQHWEALRDAGQLGQADGVALRRRWHWRLIGLWAALGLAAVLVPLVAV